MSIPFTNQSMGTLVRVLADKIILKTEQRIRFTKEQRNEIKQQQNNKCNICKTELEKFHIDHILPLASGGSNDAENLQGICISCHNDKTKKEREITNYVNDDPLRSSYNSKIRQLMNSEYVKRYAFIEKEKKCSLSISTNAEKTLCDTPNMTFQYSQLWTKSKYSTKTMKSNAECIMLNQILILIILYAEMHFIANQ